MFVKTARGIVLGVDKHGAHTCDVGNLNSTTQSISHKRRAESLPLPMTINGKTGQEATQG